MAELPTAAPGALTVDNAREVSAVVGDEQVYLPALSPDGSQIAWFNQTGRDLDHNGQICLLTFDTAAQQCSPFPAGEFLGYPYQLQWSPDNSRIAFSENPIQLGYDSDIWVLTVADGSYANLTNDDVTGDWVTQQGGPQATVDYLPMWNVQDGQIYFWRLVPQGYPNYTLGIYTIAPDGGTPREVRPVSTEVPNQVPLFDYKQWFMDGPSALSPDGSTLAVLLSTYNQAGSSDETLWLLDLTQAATAPLELMTAADFQTALPSWAPFPAQAMGLSWTADGDAVVVVAPSSGNLELPFVLFYYVAADGSGYQPVVNFSDLPDQEAYFAQPDDGGLPMRLYSPWTGSLSPEGDMLLMLNDLGGTMGLFTSVLPPTETLPAVSASSQQTVDQGSTRSSRSSDGKLIMFGLLMTVAEQ